MSWLQKLLPPRIKSTPGSRKQAMPEGLWVKCAACEAVLYRTDLEKNLSVCPKCGHHSRVGARARIDQLLDPEGRFEIGSEVLPIDSLKFKDQKKYPERLAAALEETGETDALVVMQGSIASVPLVVAVFEFNAGRFNYNRGLAHAVELNQVCRMSDLVVAGAMPNVSQPWGVYQTDWKAVLWTQGNIYYTQDQVWFQPAYYVQQMITRAWAPDMPPRPEVTKVWPARLPSSGTPR